MRYEVCCSLRCFTNLAAQCIVPSCHDKIELSFIFFKHPLTRTMKVPYNSVGVNSINTFFHDALGFRCPNDGSRQALIR